MAKSADAFVVDIGQFVQKSKGNMDELARGVASEALATLQENTPVDSGRLRAGWQLVTPVEEIIAGSTIEISNDVEYAHRVDQGFVGTDSLGRNYHQRGAHMVEKTIAMLPDIVAKVKEDLK